MTFTKWNGPAGACGIIIVCLIVAAVCHSQPQKPLADKPEVDPETGDVRFPSITVRAKEQVVEIDGKICLNEGILEFFAVAEEGREYESVVSLSCKGTNLKAALLLIGCEEGLVSWEAEELKLKPGEKPPKLGDRLRIKVEWKDGDKTVRVAAERLLIDRGRQKVPDDLPWTFTGSMFGKDFDGERVFFADYEGVFIALQYTPAAVINLDVDTGNPYRGATEGFEINKKLIPKVGTPVKLIIERVGR